MKALTHDMAITSSPTQRRRQGAKDCIEGALVPAHGCGQALIVVA